MADPTTVAEEFARATTAEKALSDRLARLEPVPPPPPPPPPPPDPTLAFTSTIVDGAALKGTVDWVATMTTGVADHVDFRIDSRTHWAEKTAPWGGALDTTALPDGAHVLTVEAYATSAALNGVAASVSITVANGVVAPPPPPPPAGPGIYGPGIAGDTKSNIQAHTKVAYRFPSPEDGTITSIRVQQRGGPVYSGGNGGTYRVGIQRDSGGVPSGAWLGTTATYAPGNSGSWNKFDSVSVSVPVKKGDILYAIHENTGSSPSSNYFSLNCLYTYTRLTPRQPRFPDASFAALVSSGSSWTTMRETPVVDIAYASGTHVGQSYVGMIGIKGMAVYASTVSGSAMARQTMRPTSPLNVTGVAVRVRKSSGSVLLRAELRDTAGAVLGTVTFPAASIPQSQAGGDNGGSVWVTGSLPAPVVFSGGELRFSCAASGGYTLAPIRDGSDSGFAPSLGYADGGAQESTNSGSSWADIYPAPLDYQCYLVTA